MKNFNSPDRLRALLATGLLAIACSIASAQAPPTRTPVLGEKLDASLLGPGAIEDMRAVLQRQAAAPTPAQLEAAKARDVRGVWLVQFTHAQDGAESRYVLNGGGATRMAIAFPTAVDVTGARFAGQGGGPGVWTPALRVVGYSRDQEVATSDWLRGLNEQWRWFDINLHGVDRIVFECEPAFDNAGWFKMDDLTFITPPAAGQPARETVVNFDDCVPKLRLLGKGEAGLTWERGSGGIQRGDAMPPPQTRLIHKPPAADDQPAPAPRGSGTTPQLESSFQGAIRGDAGQFSFPPDTCGAIGPNHFVEAINSIFAIYTKSNGSPVSVTSLGSFLPGGSGDPRVLFDQQSNRWIVIDSDFSSRIYLAVSTSTDPTGSWFKTSFVASGGSDAGFFPDYPTLGVDANGIYISAYMAGRGMSIFILDKAPLVAPSPSLGTVTAFRGLPFERAIQPTHTYGNPGGEYFISAVGTNALRVRRFNPPMTSPTLVFEVDLSVATFFDPPDVPAMGSSTPLDSVDARLINAVYRDGFIWTTHTIDVDGRAAVRWYQVNINAFTIAQSGTISDPVRGYFFPSIAITPNQDAAIGFSGSSASQFAACYFSGRANPDPPGFMAAPQLLRPGVAAQNLIDNVGRNRWGDYSLTSLDPSDTQKLWTIQEYAHANNVWGTYVGRILVFADCNGNGIEDAVDISSGTSQDCDANGKPDECQVPPLCPNCADCQADGIPDKCQIPPLCPTCANCNNNAIPDACEPDCNSSGRPDDCDIALGFSPDCQANNIPDECELPPICAQCPDCNHNGVPDECDITQGSATDCNANFIPDRCETDPPLCGQNCLADCDHNFIPDACQLAGSYSSQSPDLAPLVAPITQTYTLIAPPSAAGDVTLFFRAVGDIDSPSEIVSIDINGNPVGDIFAFNGFTCPLSNTDTLIVPAATWNAAVPGGNAAINMVPNVLVDNLCGGNSHISVEVDYPTAVGDCNANGQLDACEIAAGTATDCNANGKPDDCDIAEGFLTDGDQDGRPDECGCNAFCQGDLNLDDTVDGSDIQAFLACLQSGNLAANDCGCADMNGDLRLDDADVTLFVTKLLTDPNTLCP